MLLYISLSNKILTISIFKILSLSHSTDKFAIKAIIKDVTTAETRRYTTLCDKFSKKNTPTVAQQQHTKRAWTTENVIMVDELALSQQNQPQINCSIHQMAQAGVIGIIFFMAILVWSAMKDAC